MKKRFAKRTPESIPAWHHDFRNPETLPDVKVVRTSFFVNLVAALLLIAATIFLGVQELRRSSLRFEIDALEKRIAENHRRNQEVLGLQRDFQKEGQGIEEAVEHLRSSLDLSFLLIALAEPLPEEMRFSSIRYQSRKDLGLPSKELRISGEIAAIPDEAASILTRYGNLLQNDPVLVEIVKEAVPTSLVAVPGENKLSFGIQVVLRDGEDTDKEDKK